MKKPQVLTQSIVEVYARCPERLRRILDGEHEAPTLPMIRGKAVHYAAEVALKARVKDPDVVPLAAEAKATIADTFDRVAKQDGYYLGPEERILGTRKALGAAKDEAVRLAQPLVEAIPETNPKEVELELRVPVEPAHVELVGHLDRVDVDHAIGEYKTSRGKRQVAEFHGSFQLSMYALLYRLTYGREPHLIRVTNLVATRGGGTDVQHFETVRTKEDHKATVHRLNQTAAALKAGVFPPRTSPGTYPCHPRYCPKWDTCPAISPTTRKLIV